MFWQQVVNGFTLGSTYALIALGYTLIFGVLNIVNMAHGEIFMFGAFAGLLTMLFRYYGQYDFGACFALLLIGPLSGYLDRKLHTRIRRRETIVITEDSADA